MNYKFFSVVVLLFNSMINFFVSPAYGMDIWDIHTNNWKSLPKVKIYSRQDRDIYDVHRDGSEIYSSGCPKAPLFSTYYPERHQLSILPTQLYSHVPLASFLKLPEDIRRELEIDGVDPRSTKIFVVGQRAPSGATFTGLYPHFGTEPMAPTFGAYDVTRHLKLMITDSDSRKAKFERMPNEGEPLEIINVEKEGDIVKSTVKRKSVITHPIGGDNQVVLSPVPIRVVGIEEAQSFYTYASYPDEKGVMKGIVTLHLLWDGSQYTAIDVWSRNNFGLGPRVATRSTEELLRSFDDLIRSPAFRGGKHFERFADLLGGVTLKQAVSSPKAFGETFNLVELAAAYDFFKTHYPGMPAKEAVKNILIQRGYKDWDALSEKEQGWVVTEVSSKAEKIRLEALARTKKVVDGYRAVRATNGASDEELVAYLLGLKLEEITLEARGWIVGKVKSDAQRLHLGGLIRTKKVVDGYRAVRSTNSASDEVLVAYLLGLKLEDIIPENRGWAVAKVKSDVQRLHLRGLVHAKNAGSTYKSIRATGNGAPAEELVAYLLGLTGTWKDITLENRSWVVSLVETGIERAD